MSAPYDMINGTLAGRDVMYFFVYTNSVTNGLFVPFVLLAFFCIVLFGSVFMQIRFTSRVRFEVSLLASSFVTMGFCVILAQRNGLINPIYLFITIGLTIISAIWTFMSTE